ncbi:exopolygalacturonase-like isoform X2 [Magnolia sinica]|uniref:exopolygalacturonase-like isoform X2 n=1 Tax=Magnolia sinica TaxID=86752 RepID=UPI002658FEC7|nr:exopolygalacturonase-like isoform X2 [Magnolia sinica]XP_058092922.1 exopolygalacturonase-like isoform X2 [Magnolia sinica]
MDFLAAWESPCSYVGRSNFVMPNGEFLLGPITFTRPCHQESSPEVMIKGMVKALPDLVAFTDDSWMKFIDSRGLTVSGGGINDGQGDDAWNQKTFPKEEKCQFLPTKSSPEVVIKGMAKAIPDLVAFTNDSWIKFTDLHRLMMMSSGGIIDSQGADAWNQTTWPKEEKCQFLPTVSLCISFSIVNLIRELITY